MASTWDDTSILLENKEQKAPMFDRKNVPLVLLSLVLAITTQHWVLLVAIIAIGVIPPLFRAYWGNR